jgi:hypothetical protein
VVSGAKFRVQGRYLVLPGTSPLNPHELRGYRNIDLQGYELQGISMVNNGE